MEIMKVILTSLLSVAALFLLTKVMGHKQVAQLDFFDYITGIPIGSIAAELATELEEPLKPLIAMVVYGVIAVLLSIITNQFPKTRKYINGTPTILMNNGKFYRKNMKKAKLDLSEFMMMCRQQGYLDPSDIQTAIFEFNGKLTILPVSTKRPVTPNDLNLSPSRCLSGRRSLWTGGFWARICTGWGWTKNGCNSSSPPRAANRISVLCIVCIGRFVYITC